MIINFADDTTTIVMNTLASKDVQVRRMLCRAREIEFLIECLKSNPEGVSTKDLTAYLYKKINELNDPQLYHEMVSCETLLEWFEQYRWVTSEVKGQELIEVKFDEFLSPNDKVRFNDDDTITVYLGNCTPKTIHDYAISKSRFSGRLHINITGTYQVQVKRKYWIWKA